MAVAYGSTLRGPFPMTRIVPLLIDDDLTDALTFWRDRFGFATLVELPEDPSKDPAGQPLGFVMLDAGGATIMLQSRGSIETDTPGVLEESLDKSGVALFIEVDDLDGIMSKAAGCDVFMPERETFYGMREFGVHAPGGLKVTFAQRLEQADR